MAPIPARISTATPHTGKPSPPLFAPVPGAPGVALVTPPFSVATGDPAPGEPAGMVPLFTLIGVCEGSGAAVPRGSGVRVGAGVNVGMGAGVALPNVTSSCTG